MRTLIVIAVILALAAAAALAGGRLLGELTGAQDAQSRIEIARVQAEAAAHAQAAQAAAQAQVAVAQANASATSANALAFGAALPLVALIVVGGLIVIGAMALGYMIVVGRPPRPPVGRPAPPHPRSQWPGAFCWLRRVEVDSHTETYDCTTIYANTHNTY